MSHNTNGNYLRQRVKKGHSVSDSVEQDKKSLDILVLFSISFWWLISRDFGQRRRIRNAYYSSIFQPGFINFARGLHRLIIYTWLRDIGILTVFLIPSLLYQSTTLTTAYLLSLDGPINRWAISRMLSAASGMQACVLGFDLRATWRYCVSESRDRFRIGLRPSFSFGSGLRRVKMIDALCLSLGLGLISSVIHIHAI